MTRNIFLILTLLAAASTAARGADPHRAHASGELHLSDAMAAALANNPELRVFEADVAASQGKVATARVLANPELTVAPGIRRTREEGSSNSQFHAEFGFSQLFKFPGKRALEIAIAQRDVKLRELAQQGFRFQLTAKVRKAFYEMLAAQKIIALRKEQVESAKVFVESASKRAESGYASDFETLKSQADLIAAHKTLRQAENDRLAARYGLNVLMGRSPQAPLAIAGDLENIAPPGLPGDYIALALALNPAVRTQTEQAELAGLNLRSTRLGRRPDFAVGPSIEYTDTERTYGLSVSVALPLWDQKKGDIQTATAEQRKALADLEKTRAEIGGEVTAATTALQAARESAALYTPDFLARLKAFVAQAEQGYAQSATTLIIYLDAKRTYFDTLSDYYDALAKVASSRAELESAIGVPLETRKP
jgi:cobalt-zinc-cadmium efflux system outer membrane protein